MKKRILIICLLLFSALNFAAGRSPAVQDFIGVEPEGVDFRNPASAQGFTPFNFNQQNTTLPSNQSNHFALWVLFGMAVSLPLMSWFVLGRKNAGGQSEVAGENVHHLKDYRKSDDDDDDISQAS